MDYNTLLSQIKQWIGDSMDVHRTMLPIWERNLQYYEGVHAPAGYSLDVLQELNLYGDNLYKDDFNTIFFPVNEIKPIIKSHLAEYTSMTKSSIIESDDPRFKKIALSYKKIIDYVEKSNKVWHRVRIPCIKGCITNGLRWSKIEVGGTKKQGLFKFRCIKENYVMIDPNSTEDFFEDREFTIHLVYLNKLKAEYFLKQFNTEHSIKYTTTNQHNFYDTKFSDCVLFYYIQFKKPIINRYSFRDDPHFFSDTDYELWDCIYSTSNEILYLKPASTTQFNLTPYVYDQSELRVYPRGKIEPLRPLSDLYSVINTVILDSGRKSNRDVIGVDESTYKERLDIVNDVLAFGGAIPLKDTSLFKRIELAKMSPEMIMLLERTKQYLDNEGLIHKAMRGDIPKYDMSGKAISLLQVQNRKVLTDLDVSISYSGTQETILLYELIKNYKQFFNYINDNYNNVSYFCPIEKFYSLNQYKEFLESVEISQEDFEKNNDVRYIFPEVKNDMETVKKNTLIVVNPLIDDVHLEFDVKLDFNADKSKEIIQDKAMFLFQNDVIDGEDLVKILDFPNHDEIIAKLKQKNLFNKYKELIELFESNPAIIEQLKQILRQNQLATSKT